MTQDILQHLDDILDNLKGIKEELAININDQDLHHQVAEELDRDVLEPLVQSIDALGDMLEGIEKFGDAESMYDPYEEGLE